jgi:DNA repair exonuclease SbcCD ATPase subunit
MWVWLLCLALQQDFTPLNQTQAVQAEDLRIIERLKAIEQRIDEAGSLLPALEVIRKELAQSRREREELRGILDRFDLTPLRDSVIELGEKSAREREGILSAILGGRDAILEGIKPLGGLLPAVTGLLSEIRESRAEAAEARGGLLSGLAEVRAEVIRARAELTEAKEKLAKAQAELVEIRGSLGERFFWFAVYVVGGCAVLLVGGSLIIGFVYVKLAKLIHQIPIPKVI